MERNKAKIARRNKIRRRIRSTIRGTADQPRFAVFKSNKHIYLQLINDLDGVTLLANSSTSPAMQDALKKASGIEAAAIIGEQLAKDALEQGITRVVFDRGGYKYHGIVKAAAEGARKGGLDF